MKLIVDCGSTKADYAIIDNNKEVSYMQSIGFNALQTELNTIKEIISFLPKDFDEIYFFGSGVMGQGFSKLKEAFLPYCTKEENIFVYDDLYGAYLSLFGNKGSGIACILGTGSNTGYFSKGKLVEKVMALGYILGDEGSGAKLGIRLINALYKKSVDNSLTQKFEKQYNININQIIEQTYKLHLGGKYLAQFTPFILENIEVLEDLVIEEFKLFFNNNIIKYPNYQNLPIGFVGSIAKHFEKQLKKVASLYNISNIKILARPIEQLAK